VAPVQLTVHSIVCRLLLVNLGKSSIVADTHPLRG